MATDTTTRRTVLGAIAALPVVALAAPALATPAIDRTAWERILGRYQRAKAASAEADRRCEAAYDEFKRIEPSDEAIPFREFTIMRGAPTRYERHHIARIMDVEQEWELFLSLEGKTWFARDPEKRKGEYRAALDAVTDYRRRLAEAERSSGYNAASDRSDRLGDVCSEIENELIETPAPDRAALLYKMERLFGPEARGVDNSCPAWCAAWINTVMADAHRLLSGEA
jgi:hypothetical protein